MWVSEVPGDSRRVPGLWIFGFYPWFLKVKSDFKSAVTDLHWAGGGRCFISGHHISALKL